MKLSPRQLHALSSICDTFAPAENGWPSACDLKIPEAIAAAVDVNPRSSDRAHFLQLLDLWDSYLHSFLTAGRIAAFSSLSPDVRIHVLLSWADSTVARR